MDGRDLAIIAVVAVAPLAIVLIFALLRSYTIDVRLSRNGKRGRRRRDSDDDEAD